MVLVLSRDLVMPILVQSSQEIQSDQYAGPNDSSQHPEEGLQPARHNISTRLLIVFYLKIDALIVDGVIPVVGAQFHVQAAAHCVLVGDVLERDFLGYCDITSERQRRGDWMAKFERLGDPSPINDPALDINLVEIRNRYILGEVSSKVSVADALFLEAVFDVILNMQVINTQPLRNKF